MLVPGPHLTFLPKQQGLCSLKQKNACLLLKNRMAYLVEPLSLVLTVMMEVMGKVGKALVGGGGLP